MQRRRSPAHHIVARIMGPLTLAALATSCQPIAGPVEVKAVVWDEEKLAVAFEQTTLETPVDLLRGDGDNILVRQDVLCESFTAFIGAENLTYDEYVGRNRDSLSARPLDLAVHDEDGVFVPDDFESLVSLSMWNAVEKTIDFLRASGETGPAVDNDLIVGIHGRINVFGAAPSGPDNAAYSPIVDMMLIGPPVLSGFISAVNGTPDIGTSPGVIAHELGHRVFNFHVGVPTDFWRIGTVGDTASAKLYGAFNEGFADLLAVGVIGTPELQRMGLTEQRNLLGEFASSVTYDDLASGTPVETCGNEAPGFTSEGFDQYCLATVFAAAVFEGAGADIATYRTVVFPTLLRSLDDTAALVIARTAADDGVGSFRAEDVLDPFVRALPDAALRASMCESFARRFKSLVDGGLVCGG